MKNLKPGTVLIADPFLKDTNFMRSVIFLCDHQDEEGSFGFVINNKCDKNIGELFADLDGCDFPVYFGGPVQMNALHFLHRCPGLITSGVEISDGIFWGAEFSEVIDLIGKKRLSRNQIKFFLGYSGWAVKQLETEISEKTWLLTEGNKRLVFHHEDKEVWKDALKQLGGEFEQLIHYPIDPQLN